MLASVIISGASVSVLVARPRSPGVSASDTEEYWLAAEIEVPHSTGSVFLGLLIPRRS